MVLFSVCQHKYCFGYFQDRCENTIKKKWYCLMVCLRLGYFLRNSSNQSTSIYNLKVIMLLFKSVSIFLF